MENSKKEYCFDENESKKSVQNENLGNNVTLTLSN